MSIEQRLAEEFKRDSGNRICPPELDARIAAEYRQLVVSQGRERFMWRKGKAVKIILIAVIVLAVCGFGLANQLLFEDHKDGVAVSYQSDQQLHFEPADVEKIRSSLAEVKAQLAPGDTAVVYLKDYELKIGGSPVVFGINKPISLQPDAWRATLKQHNIGETLPETLLGTFKLLEGMESSPYQFNFGGDAYRLLDDMKTESQKTESPVLWRKTELSGNQPIVPYTSVYRNASNDTIYLTWQIADSNADVRLVQAAPPGTKYEDITINGVNAHYLMNDQALFGQSTIQQDVMWLKESGAQTIIYHVQSDSTTLTKAQLIQAAQSLLQ